MKLSAIGTRDRLPVVVEARSMLMSTSVQVHPISFKSLIAGVGFLWIVYVLIKNK